MYSNRNQTIQSHLTINSKQSVNFETKIVKYVTLLCTTQIAKKLIKADNCLIAYLTPKLQKKLELPLSCSQKKNRK